MKKSVREMNYLERLHYSLSARMFHTILMFSMVLALVALVFALTVYSNNLKNQYSEKASILADDIVLAIDPDLMGRIVKEAESIYNDLDETVRSDTDSEAYLRAFDGLKDFRYHKIHEILNEFMNTNKAESIIIGQLVDESHFMYLFDVSGNEETYPLGHIEEVSQDTINAFEKIGSLMPVIFDRSDDGYNCTGAGTISRNGREIATIVTAYSLNDVAQRVRQFLLQFFVLMFLVTVLIDNFIIRKMKRTVVTPIEELNEAARAHMQSKEELSELHFNDLNIHTGDEIESLALIMADMEKRLQGYVQDLTAITAERERIATELNVASQIQEGMLPNIFPPFPERKEFDIYASMFTAKEVGGDFYDFFLVDDDHLALVIADVSGKGIPAALFMMASKIIISNLATIGITDPGTILQEVNKRIVRNNPMEMFVTVWLGILEISTGILRASNGGHEYPFVLLKDDRYGMFRDRHGFVLGGIDNSTYTTYELKLEKGNRIFVYTDGVTDATNQDKEQFGDRRLLQALNDKPDASVKELLKHVKYRIDEFVQDAPQFDDITMLALQYNGGSKMEELTIEATIDNIPFVTQFVDEKLETLDCPVKAQMQIDVAIDELFSNIAKFAYHPETGPATVRVEVEKDPMAVIITFIDHGMPYDPLAKDDPDVTLDIEDRMIGGLGVYLVKKTMDDVSYEYKDGQNILRIKKNL